MKPKFKDLASLKEDERIDQIVAQVKLGRTVGVVTDDIPGKPERYIEKMKVKLPGINIIARMRGPTKGVVTIKVGPPSAAMN